jgi:Flp pilus assembly protein TadG
MSLNKQDPNKARRGLLRNLFRKQDGAVAIQFSLLAMPLLVLAFGLFDISRASIAKQQLQDALDAASLLAARSTATTDAQLNAVAQAALLANLSNMDDATLITSNFHFNGGSIDATAQAAVRPIISNLWLNGDMNVAANSQVTRANRHVEVALVLDNTGSMLETLGAGQKISALRTAAQGLVNTLQAAAQRSGDPNSVRIGVVPFSMTVNVGSGYQNATWMSGVQPSSYGPDLFGSSNNVNRFTVLSQMGMTWGGCVESRPAPFDIQDDAPSLSIPSTRFVPFFAPDEPDDNKISTGWTTFDYANNYITNDKTGTSGSTLSVVQTRQGNVSKYNNPNLAYGAGSTTFGPNAGCTMAPIQRLTTDFSAVNSRLSSMVAAGNTNVAMGLVWGWHVLSPNSPFSDGTAYGTQGTDKVIVLLTDGDNTNDQRSEPEDSIYTGLGYIWQRRLQGPANNGNYLDVGSTGTDRRDAIDARETALCNNLRTRGIYVYTIGVGTSSHSDALLRSCATDPSFYFDVNNTSQLNTVFNTIAGAIQNLRISH